jgi:protease I
MSVQGRSVAFVTSATGIEQAGGRPVLVATTHGNVQAFNHLDPADTFPVDQPASTADPDEYAAVVPAFNRELLAAL